MAFPATLRLLLVASLALAGCAGGDPDPAAAPVPSDQTPDAAGAREDAAAPQEPTWGRLDETYDLQVTSVGVAEDLSIGYEGNCLQVTAGSRLAGTATLTWAGTPTTATLDLVAFAWPDGKDIRVRGPSPLVLDFEFLAADLGSDDSVEFSVQTPPPMASVAQAATLQLNLTHDPDVPPAPDVTSCGF